MSAIPKGIVRVAMLLLIFKYLINLTQTEQLEGDELDFVALLLELHSILLHDPLGAVDSGVVEVGEVAEDDCYNHLKYQLISNKLFEWAYIN